MKINIGVTDPIWRPVRSLQEDLNSYGCSHIVCEPSDDCHECIFDKAVATRDFLEKHKRLDKED